MNGTPSKCRSKMNSTSSKVDMNVDSVNGDSVNGDSVNEDSVNGDSATNGHTRDRREATTAMNGRTLATSASASGGPHLEEHPFEEGALLKKVLEVTLREKLMARLDEGEPVVNFKQPEDLTKIFSWSLSSSGCDTMEQIEEIIEKIVKYSVKTTHPHFYNQLYGGLDEVALSGAWLMEALNTNQYTYEVAPVFVVMEHLLVNQMHKLFGWGSGDGIFSPGGSTSNMYGLILARHKKFPSLKETGFFGQKELVIFTSDMSHYSIQKAASWMGYGTNQVVKVASDEHGRMRASRLREAIRRVRHEGREPLFVNATSGTTVFGAFDPLEELALVCQEEDVWLHIDACWGGSVILSRKRKHLMKGIERVDSLAWNPHKMLCAPLQCSVFLVKHKGLLSDCNRAGASYLFQKDKFYDVAYDLGDKSVQCGRKPDALKLWLMFKVHGLEVFEERVDAAFEAACYLEKEIRRREGFRLVLKERDCTNVCFWFIPPSLRGCEEDEEWWLKIHRVAPTIKERMVKAGTLLVGYQPVETKNLVNFFRMVTTGFPVSTKKDMEFVLDEIHRLGEDL